MGLNNWGACRKFEINWRKSNLVTFRRIIKFWRRIRKIGNSKG